MVNRVYVSGAALMAAALYSQTACADGFRNPPDTAAALGKSGKHIVWVDDAAALFVNPANLTDVASAQVQLSTLIGYSRADYLGQLGRTETERPWSVLPSFAAAWPLRETDLALGLGVHVPYGRQTRWDSGGPFRYTAPVFSQMTVTDVSPALAWRLSDSVSVGCGLDLYYGTLQFRQQLPFLQDSRVTAEADGYAAGANVGITWAFTADQRLALTCRSPFDLTFRGHLDTTGIPQPAVASSELDTTFTFPTIVALGYGIKVTETVRLEANVEWLQHSRFKTMEIDAGANHPLLAAMGVSHTPQNWNDTWTFGVGADWRFAPAWSLRAGYLYLQSPIPDTTFTPSALDTDQSLVSVGLGYKKGHHAVDFAYALGLFTPRSVDDNQNPLYRNGAYEFQGHLAVLTYTYRF